MRCVMYQANVSRLRILGDASNLDNEDTRFQLENAYYCVVLQIDRSGCETAAKGTSDAWFSVRLSERDILAFIFGNVLDRVDAETNADELLAGFGDCASLFRAASADHHCGSKDVDRVTTTLKHCRGITQWRLPGMFAGYPGVNDPFVLGDYLAIDLACRDDPTYRLLCLDAAGCLLSDIVISVGESAPHAHDFRRAAAAAQRRGARCLILVHANSDSDAKWRRSDEPLIHCAIAEAARQDLLLRDFLVVSRQGYLSFKALGLL